MGVGSTVVVREHRDGALTLLQGGAVLRWHELGQRPKAVARRIQRRVVTRPKPAPDHPWQKPIHAAQRR